MRSVADHIDLVGFEFVSMFFLSPCPGEGPQLVAIVMIIGESAELEEMPYPVVLEFQLGAARNVSGQQRQNEVGPSLELFQ